jgi:hypothetical protein
MNKIQGFKRKQIKKELFALKSHKKNFWFWSSINEDMYNGFNLPVNEFKQAEKKSYDNLVKRIEKLQSILEETI